LAFIGADSEAYREPLVLFYRERQSVERVAEGFGIDPGRGQATAFARAQTAARTGAGVCGRALKQTSPGNAFTLGVLAALPEMTTSAKASRCRSCCSQRQRRGEVSRFGRVCQRISGTILMFLSFCFWFRLDRDSTRSPQMRDFVIKCWRIIIGCIAVFMLAMFSLMLGGWPLAVSRPALFAGLFIDWVRPTYALS